MRQMHVKVTLDVEVSADDDAVDVGELFEGATVNIELDEHQKGRADIQDVTIEGTEVTDSR